MSEGVEQRVVVFPPTAKDGEVTRRLLKDVGVEGVLAAGMKELVEMLAEGAGGVLLTEVALTAPGVEAFGQWVEQQPAWSDLPVVLMMRGASNSPAAERLLKLWRNVTLLERPAPVRSVISAVQTAIRARRRQYQIRDQMEEIRAGAEERRGLLESEQAARQEAERASAMKDEFLATLSHELRTPLNAIFGWTQILKGATDRETMAEGVAVIDRNVRTQTQLIEDLLDVSRIISGKVRLKIEAVELRTVVRAAIDAVQPVAEGKGVRIVEEVAGDAGSVRGDFARLQQVVWNLLTNAIKFTPAGGRIEVAARRVGEEGRVGGEGRTGGEALLRVRDSGEGISAEFLPVMFQRFQQADGSTTRRHGGLGLGLSIVKSLVEMHGGTVTADSGGAGMGATFEVRLPVAEPAEARGGPASGGAAGREGEPSPLRGVKVLVVDDEPDARDVVRRFLLACEAVPMLAASAEEARRVMEGFHPDVILSDIGMPGEDGYTFMRGMRAKGDQTPAVAVTAFARSEDHARSLQAGFQRHLPKPVEPEELLAVIAALSRSA